MNNFDQWRTTITIQDPARKSFWEGQIGTATLPIKSLIPVLCDFPGLPNSLAYMLDVQAIPPDMQAKIASALAGRFGVDVDEILRDFDEGNAPILAAGCQVQTTDPVILAAILL